MGVVRAFGTRQRSGVTLLERRGGQVLGLRAQDGAYVACHGANDPVGEAAMWLPPEWTNAEPPAAVVLIGGCCGYLIDAVERAAPTAAMIAIEPEPEAVRWALERRDWSERLSSGRLRLLVGPEYAGASEAAVHLEPNAPVPILVNPVLASARPADVERCRTVADRLLFDARANRAARTRLAATYLQHTLDNIGVLTFGADASALHGCLAGTPAIIVGAGPSLDRHLETLRRVRSDAAIVAVDTACLPLLAAGVEPDLVIAVDPSQENAEHLTALADVGGAWLVAEASVAPAAFEVFRDRVFTFKVGRHHPWPWLETHGITRPTVRVWGSVLTAALDLALSAGCNPIVFVGADLAFTGGRPYCRGTAFEERWAEDVAGGSSLDEVWRAAIAGSDPIHAEDIGGASVLTSSHLAAFRDWIVERTREHADRRFVNASGAGILHGGAIVQSTLSDALDARVPTHDVRHAIRSAHAASPRLQVDAREALARQCDPARIAGVLPDWLAFAQGLDESGVADALRRARQTLESRRGSIDSAARGGARARRKPAAWLDALTAAGGIEATTLSSCDLVQTTDPFSVPHGPRPFDLLETEPLVQLGVAADQVVHDAGRCYRFLFRTSAGRHFSYTSQFARLPLYEDGIRLPRGGSMHEDIRVKGEGRYSMWPLSVYFSSSDGSDPRSNGRQYTFPVPRYLGVLESLPASLVRKLGL